jgi:hypothetical protein
MLDLSAGAGGIAYAIMFQVARRQLLQNLNVICDSPLAYKRRYDRAVAVATETGARLAIIECDCPDDAVLRDRIIARQSLTLASHHTTDWAAVEAFRARESPAGVLLCAAWTYHLPATAEPKRTSSRPCTGSRGGCVDRLSLGANRVNRLSPILIGVRLGLAL